MRLRLLFICVIPVLFLINNQAYSSAGENNGSKPVVSVHSNDSEKTPDTETINISSKPTADDKQPPKYKSPENLWKDPIGSILSLLSIIVAAWMVVFQLKRQHSNGLKLQRESFKKKVNLDVYENISNVVDNASSAISSVGMSIYNLPFRIESSPNTKLYFNPENFNIQHHAAFRLIADVLLILEKYEIALPGFRVFRLALNVQADRGTEAFNKVFYPMLNYMRIDQERNNDIYLEISEDEVETFKKAANGYWEEGSTLVSYLSDVQVDAQNLLLYKTFNNRVPKRSPSDPKFIAISGESEEEERIIEFLRQQAPRKEYFDLLLNEYKAQQGNNPNT